MSRVGSSVVDAGMKRATREMADMSDNEESAPQFAAAERNLHRVSTVSESNSKVGTMTRLRATEIDDLHKTIDQKLTILVREMEDAGWSVSEVARALSDVIKVRWLGQTEKLGGAPEAASKSFVSDGNEG